MIIIMVIITLFQSERNLCKCRRGKFHIWKGGNAHDFSRSQFSIKITNKLYHWYLQNLVYIWAMSIQDNCKIAHRNQGVYKGRGAGNYYLGNAQIGVAWISKVLSIGENRWDEGRQLCHRSQSEILNGTSSAQDWPLDCSLSLLHFTRKTEISLMDVL